MGIEKLPCGREATDSSTKECIIRVGNSCTQLCTKASGSDSVERRGGGSKEKRREGPYRRKISSSREYIGNMIFTKNPVKDQQTYIKKHLMTIKKNI